jgi:Tfp pilus assembly protein PilO
MNIKIVQIITVILLGSSFYLIYEVVNTYPDINIYKDKIKAQELTVTNSRDILQRTEELVSFTAKNKEVVARFDSILPANEDKANLLSSLDNLAYSNNLGTTKIGFKETDNSKKSDSSASNDFSTSTIRMSVRGSYISFKNFLDAIEKNIRVLDVVSVNFTLISPSKKDDEKDQDQKNNIKTYSYEIVLKSYLFKPAKTENVARLLSTGQFINFSLKNLNFSNEKVFRSLQVPDGYNVDAASDEIGNQDIF